MANGGEALRRNRTQEVAGSSPASSIRKKPANARLWFSTTRTEMAEISP
jgi:hypothetical protein